MTDNLTPEAFRDRMRQNLRSAFLIASEYREGDAEPALLKHADFCNCLANDEVNTELVRAGYRRRAWAFAAVATGVEVEL